MSIDVSERSFEDAIECGRAQHGPEACAGDATAVRETPPAFGDMPPGGYRRCRPEDSRLRPGELGGDVNQVRVHRRSDGVELLVAREDEREDKKDRHHRAPGGRSAW